MFFFLFFSLFYFNFHNHFSPYFFFFFCIVLYNVFRLSSLLYFNLYNHLFLYLYIYLPIYLFIYLPLSMSVSLAFVPSISQHLRPHSPPLTAPYRRPLPLSDAPGIASGISHTSPSRQSRAAPPSLSHPEAACIGPCVLPVFPPSQRPSILFLPPVSHSLLFSIHILTLPSPHFVHLFFSFLTFFHSLSVFFLSISLPSVLSFYYASSFYLSFTPFLHSFIRLLSFPFLSLV